jgi:hypothetical protein
MKKPKKRHTFRPITVSEGVLRLPPMEKLRVELTTGVYVVTNAGPSVVYISKEMK